MVSSSTSEERTGQGYKGNSNGGNGGSREYKPRSYNKDYKSGTDGERKDYRSGNNGERKDYRGQNNTERKDYRSNNGNGTERRDYRSNNGNGTERKDYRSNNGNGTERKDYRSNNGTGEGNRDYRKRDGSERPYNNNRFNKDKDEDDYGQSRNSRSGNNHGKDFKNSYNNSRDGRNGDSRGGSGQRETKVKEQQPDKLDIVKRLEKEKKVMQKKSEANNKKAKAANARPQVKVKRTNNIDWTKEYENDSFDDDDTSYTFY